MTAVSVPAKIPGRGRRWFVATGWRHGVGIAMLVFALFPVWFVVLAAFSKSSALSSQNLWPEAFTLRQYHKVNTYDNFHVVTVINFDPAARYTGVTVETACGNGLPDSAQ